MRIAIGGLMHESNTFAPAPTELGAFRVHRGEEILRHWSDTHHELTGFLQGAREHGCEPVPTLMAGATPAGTVTADAYETLTGELAAAVRSSGGLDGMLLACHGAMVSQDYPDADGETIRRVREALGPGVPLVVTLDFHTNVSQRMVDSCDALVIYKTNPHIDQRQRGLQAAGLLARAIRGEVRPVQALAKPPMVWNILHQYTRAEPLRTIMEDAAGLETRPEILAASIAAGYPYADVEETGPSVVIVADGDAAGARREAERLSNLLWEARERIRIDLPGPAGAVARAIASERPPAVIVEMGDNIGGGSPGDSTAILSELVRQRARGAVSILYDPASARACAAAGIGAEVRLQIGGKSDRLHGDPVAVSGRVRSLHEGLFHEPEARHGGVTRWDQGLTAVIELPDTGQEEGAPTCVVVNSRRTAPMSLHQVTSLGIRPERQRILVVKAAIAYRAAYEPIAGEIIESDTPGVTAVNPLRFDYRHVRRPLWPFESS